MRFVRQAALLLLVLLLAGGPALHALAQATCMTKQAHCPMCAHRAEPMSCMGAQAMTARVAVATDLVPAVVAVSENCVCGQVPAAQVEQTSAGPSSLVDQAPVLSVAIEPAWPSAGQLVRRGVPAGAPVALLLPRSCAAMPLRV